MRPQAPGAASGGLAARPELMLRAQRSGNARSPFALPDPPSAPSAGTAYAPWRGGMFYSRETPAHEVYVREGDHFNAGDPLFIVEVMKMFNKVYAPFSGTIAKVLVHTDGCIISKGQPIFKIIPDEISVAVCPEDIAKQRLAVTTEFLQQL